MRNGLRVSFAMNEFVVAAMCLTVIVCSVGYFCANAPRPTQVAPPAGEACVHQPGVITIWQTIHVTPSKVRVVVPPAPKKEYNGEDDGDYAAPDSGVKGQDDPVFKHRTPIVTKALQDSLYTARN